MGNNCLYLRNRHSYEYIVWSDLKLATSLFPKIPYLCALISAIDEHRNPHLDVSCIAVGWSGSGHGVVCPKQETTLWQSVDNHFVRIANFDCESGGVAALQPAHSAEVQLGGDPDPHSCARQFIIRRPLQGFGVLQKRLSNTV